MYLFKSAPRSLFSYPKTHVKLGQTLPLSWVSTSSRSLASSFGKNPIDEKVDAISEQYAIVRDELEIAVEQTEKGSIYAAEDRATVHRELGKLETLFRDTVSSSPTEQGNEVKRRVEQRIRELKNAVNELDKADSED